jgi:hypothetical protein
MAARTPPTTALSFLARGHTNSALKTAKSIGQIALFTGDGKTPLEPRDDIMFEVELEDGSFGQACIPHTRKEAPPLATAFTRPFVLLEGITPPKYNTLAGYLPSGIKIASLLKLAAVGKGLLKIDSRGLPEPRCLNVIRDLASLEDLAEVYGEAIDYVCQHGRERGGRGLHRPLGRRGPSRGHGAREPPICTRQGEVHCLPLT